MTRSHRLTLAFATIAVAFACGACRGAGQRARQPEVATPPETAKAPAQVAEESHKSESIVIAGKRYPIGAPVVLWTDPGGYSAYATELFFGGDRRTDSPKGPRYRPGRGLKDGETRRQSLTELQSLVDQLVLHFDVCGVSRECFRVLHDRRGLSVHFMLDIDGTLYQTLDLCETAWHARQANPRSVGVEIANIGAYPPGKKSLLDEWYVRDEKGTRIKIPAELGDGGVRTRGFVGRPARPERVRGTVQGIECEMYDFTPEQYDTLVALSAALCRAFPRIEPDAPRTAVGTVATSALAPQTYDAFHGILGHLHVTEEKNDPGPALDWERLLTRVRAKLAQP